MLHIFTYRGIKCLKVIRAPPLFSADGIFALVPVTAGVVQLVCVFALAVDADMGPEVANKVCPGVVVRLLLSKPIWTHSRAFFGSI